VLPVGRRALAPAQLRLVVSRSQSPPKNSASRLLGHEPRSKPGSTHRAARYDQDQSRLNWLEDFRLETTQDANALTSADNLQFAFSSKRFTRSCTFPDVLKRPPLCRHQRT
jgi:hypothetical protein